MWMRLLLIKNTKLLLRALAQFNKKQIIQQYTRRGSPAMLYHREGSWPARLIATLFNLNCRALV